MKKKENTFHTRWLRLVTMTLFLGAAIFFAACGSGLSGMNSSNNSSSNPNNTAKEKPPGTEEFGLTKEELVKSIETVEQRIAACMNKAGFEYLAVDYNTVRKGMLADKSLPGVTERDYVAQYGYGISTFYTGLPPQLADETTATKIGLGEQNIANFNKLSAADRVAYARALLGEFNDSTFAVALEREDFSRTGGCTREAIAQVFTADQLKATYVNPLDARVEQDPRMVEALGKFSECLRAKGFKYNRPDDIEPDLRKRLDAITHSAPLDALTPDAVTALKQLQGEERAIAVAELGCTVEIIEPVEEQVLRELHAGTVQ